MPSPATLQVVVGVSTFLGLLSLLAYLFVGLQLNRARTSVREAVEGEGILKSGQVVKILAMFKDDPSRLSALATLTNYSEKQADQVLSKVKDNVDLMRLQSLSDSHARKYSAIAAAFFLAVAGVAFLSQGTDRRPQPSAVVLRSRFGDKATVFLDGKTIEIPTGTDLSVPISRDSSQLSLHSCGWDSASGGDANGCRNIAASVKPGEIWEVVPVFPHPRIDLQRGR